MQPAAPNCMKCEHHFITYDPQFPYGCRALGFKSRGQPCLEVRASSGMECQMFLPRRPVGTDSRA